MPSARVVRPLATLLICATIGIAVVCVSYSAVLTKSATLDEPIHAVSAYAAADLHDYRLDPENPPLWKYWAALGIPRGMLHIATGEPAWQHCVHPDTGQVYTTRLLYQTPGIDGRAVVDSARRAMALLSLLVIVTTAAWAYRLAGPPAAVAATLLLSLDPTFLGHAAVVKNDVVMMLFLLALVVGLWRATRRLTLANVLLIALACGGAMSAKFSGLLWIGIAAIALLSRAILPRPWAVGRKSVERRGWRLVAAVGAMVAVAAVSVFCIWASYGFRYGVSPDAAERIDVPQIVSDIATMQLTRDLDRPPTPAELAGWSPPLNVRTALFLDRHRLLPQPWTTGFLGVYREMLRHPNYLLGEVRVGRGWWYYFPLALVFKTPVTTLLILAAAAALVASRRVRLDDDCRRALLCIALASAVYFGSAMMQTINHGVRHLLPVLALFYVAVGVVFARAVATWRRPALIVAPLLALALAVEVLPAYPDFIAYFNLPSGGSRGGLALLGDSNLDWGQDLPLLAAWQRQHQSERLYYACYGTVDPAAYGIRYTNLAGGFFLGPSGEPLTTPGVIAISATHLQGLFLPPELAHSYERLHAWRPREILGGTIYLYDYPPR